MVSKTGRPIVFKVDEESDDFQDIVASSESSFNFSKVGGVLGNMDPVFSNRALLEKSPMMNGYRRKLGDTFGKSGMYVFVEDKG